MHGYSERGTAKPALSQFSKKKLINTMSQTMHERFAAGHTYSHAVLTLSRFARPSKYYVTITATPQLKFPPAKPGIKAVTAGTAI